jgi:hypothetical protein
VPRPKAEELFAQLTALFEDAAALAAERQKRGTNETLAKALVGKISTAQAEGGRLIDKIAGRMQQ